MKRALLGLTALVLSCSYSPVNRAPVPPAAPKYDTLAAKVELAQCLVEKDVIMYGAEWCGYCRIEKEEFGEAWKILEPNYVDCAEDSNEARCEAEARINGVRRYPTWRFSDGTIIQGHYPNFLERLARKSGCNDH